MGQCHGGEPLNSEFFTIPSTGVRLRVRSHTMFGWNKDPPDYRDHVLQLPEARTRNLPTQVDLRPKDGFDIYDQGDLGSCTAHAIAAAFQYELVVEGEKFRPSRLFIYYNQRTIDSSEEADAGASIRDGIRSLAKIGVCSEKEWPYEIPRFADRPTSSCFRAARAARVLEYARVPQTLADLKGCINEGYPIIFGFMVLTSFVTRAVADSGEMPMPQRDDRVLGGHSALAVGYDDDRKAFIVRNSWGAAWGEGGYFYMPYSFITWDQLASDFWAIKVTEGPAEDFPTRKM